MYFFELGRLRLFPHVFFRLFAERSIAVCLFVRACLRVGGIVNDLGHFTLDKTPPVDKFETQNSSRWAPPLVSRVADSTCASLGTVPSSVGAPILVLDFLLSRAPPQSIYIINSSNTICVLQSFWF